MAPSVQRRHFSKQKMPSRRYLSEEPRRSETKSAEMCYVYIVERVIRQLLPSLMQVSFLLANVKYVTQFSVFWCLS